MTNRREDFSLGLAGPPGLEPSLPRGFDAMGVSVNLNHAPSNYSQIPQYEAESPEDRKKRLAKERARKCTAQRRSTESEEQREKRLKRERERVARARQNESPEKREKRLKRARESTAQRRAMESDEIKEMRRREQRERVALKRLLEAPEKRATRLLKLRERRQKVLDEVSPHGSQEGLIGGPEQGGMVFQMGQIPLAEHRPTPGSDPPGPQGSGFSPIVILQPQQRPLPLKLDHTPSQHVRPRSQRVARRSVQQWSPISSPPNATFEDIPTPHRNSPFVVADKLPVFRLEDGAVSFGGVQSSGEGNTQTDIIESGVTGANEQTYNIGSSVSRQTDSIGNGEAVIGNQVNNRQASNIVNSQINNIGSRQTDHIGNRQTDIGSRQMDNIGSRQTDICSEQTDHTGSRQTDNVFSRQTDNVFSRQTDNVFSRQTDNVFSRQTDNTRPSTTALPAPRTSRRRGAQEDGLEAQQLRGGVTVIGGTGFLQRRHDHPDFTSGYTLDLQQKFGHGVHTIVNKC